MRAERASKPPHPPCPRHRVSRLVAGAPHTSTTDGPAPIRRLRCERSEPRNPRTRPAHRHRVSRLVAGAPHTSTSDGPAPIRRLRCERSEPRNPRTRPAHRHRVSRLVAGAPHTSTSGGTDSSRTEPGVDSASLGDPERDQGEPGGAGGGSLCRTRGTEPAGGQPVGDAVQHRTRGGEQGAGDHDRPARPSGPPRRARPAGRSRRGPRGRPRPGRPPPRAGSPPAPARPRPAGGTAYARPITSCTVCGGGPSSSRVSSGSVSPVAGPRPSSAATTATSASRASHTADPTSPSSQPAPSACRTTCRSTTAAAPAPVPATSTAPDGSGVPAAKAASRSGTTTGSPRSPSRRHASAGLRLHLREPGRTGARDPEHPGPYGTRIVPGQRGGDRACQPVDRVAPAGALVEARALPGAERPSGRVRDQAAGRRTARVDPDHQLHGVTVAISAL